MGAQVREDQDTEELNLTVKVPRNFPSGIAQSLEESVTRAVQILVRSKALQEMFRSADDLARLIVTQTCLSGIMLEERIAQVAMVRKVFEVGDWLTADDINNLQQMPLSKKSLPTSDWKRRRRIFSVPYNGKDYYPRYQFDAMYQPLPVIRDILKAYGECKDPWSLAIWFQFPNGWIAKQLRDAIVPVAPKDALDRAADVIKAARNHRGTYVA